VRGWLLSIVHHRAVDVLRRKTAFRPAPLEAAEHQAADDDTAAEATRNVEQATVRAALEALPPAQRRTIELAYFGGYTHVELAKLMGVPLGTVKGRMRIGLQKLRRALEIQERAEVPR
jgi:RNA polymerase sigma-70 factor (ECF subfamily)